MPNTFMNGLKQNANYTYTENGALAHKSTGSALYDLFALGAAYRTRTDEDCILLFRKAFDENPTYAMKCLFYIRDVRGGQGERRFFRVCMRDLVGYNRDAAARNLPYVAEYGRFDDLFAITHNTSLWSNTIDIIKKQLAMDIQSHEVSDKTPVSLLAKWMPSENTSSQKTRALANELRKALKMSHKQYRKTLSLLRTRINIVEKLMSSNRWDEIEFDKLPSKAGKIYRKAFERHDLQRQEANPKTVTYKEFAKDENTKVNAKTLYPYEVVAEALKLFRTGSYYSMKSLPAMDDTQRLMVNKYWDGLADYFNGASLNALAVVDTSASMCGNTANAPLNVAISLGLYCAERAKGPFAGHYVSFSSRPQLIATEGVDFCDKVQRIYQTNLCQNTNLEATFNMLLNTAIQNHCTQDELPETILVISDMEIDQGSEFRSGYWGTRSNEARTRAKTMMEQMRIRWAEAGYVMPSLVYWNVDSRNDTILDDGPNVSYVSGASPAIFQQIMTKKTGYDLMMEALDSKRYAVIQ